MPIHQFTKQSVKSGNDLLTVENLTVKMDGETILDNISFILRPGDKTAQIISQTIFKQLH